MTNQRQGDAGILEPSLESRYREVMQRVAAAATRSGRSPKDIVVVAVTKYAEPDQIRSLINMGHRDFGENRVQNLIQRVAIIDEYMVRRRAHPDAAKAGGLDGGDSVRWHMIGHLQRNKAKKTIELCRLIHSVDSLRLAEEIQQAATKREEPVDVLVQVNCSGEKSKFGCPVPAALHLAE